MNSKEHVINHIEQNSSDLIAFILLILCCLSFMVHAEEKNQQNSEPVQVEQIEQSVSSVNGSFPPDTLLNTLQQRLLAPPDCLPYCANSPRMRIELTANQLQIRLEIHSHDNVAIPLPGHAEQWLPQQIWIDEEPARDLFRDEQGYLWLSLTTGIHQVHLSGLLPNRQTIQLPLPLKPHFVEVQATQWRVEGIHENGLADAQLQLTRQSVEGETALTDLEMGTLPPFVRVERTLLLGLEWQIETRVTRLTPLGSAIVLEIPLLLGESVTSERVRVEGNKALLNLSPNEGEISWLSVFNKQETIELIAPTTTTTIEVWRLDASAIWHVEIEGIAVVHHQNAEGQWLPEWRPWPGEKITLHLSRPEGVIGQVVTIDYSRLIVAPGQRSTESNLAFNLRSSRGGQHQLRLPEDAQLQTINVNGTPQPIRQEGQVVTLPLIPGNQQVELSFRQPIGINQRFTTPTVDLGIDSVNTHITVKLSNDRWILFVGGHAVGPAVLIWSLLLIVILVAIGLGRISFTPLNTLHWLLLGIVLTQVEIVSAFIVVAWFIALGWRVRVPEEMIAWKFDLIQLGLIFLTIAALSVLAFAIQQGLLGHPQMHIAGNGSSASALHWYVDRIDGTIPQVWVISISMWWYRVAMLAWALWLAFALLRWLQWGWQCFSQYGIWKKPLPKQKTLK